MSPEETGRAESLWVATHTTSRTLGVLQGAILIFSHVQAVEGSDENYGLP